MSKKTKIIIIIIGLVAIIIMVIWALRSDHPSIAIDHPRPFKGNSNAGVVLTEFSDFQCPACKTAASSVKSLAEQYQDKIKIEFRHFPLVTIHANAYRAALSAECAFDQGKFWEMHDLLFQNQNDLSLNKLKNYAGQIAGLNTNTFNTCLDNQAKADVVNADIKKGNALSVDGTPTFFLNGKAIDDRYSLEDNINKALENNF